MNMLGHTTTCTCLSFIGQLVAADDDAQPTTASTAAATVPAAAITTTTTTTTTSSVTVTATVTTTTAAAAAASAAAPAKLATITVTTTPTRTANTITTAKHPPKSSVDNDIDVVVPAAAEGRNYGPSSAGIVVGVRFPSAFALQSDVSTAFERVRYLSH